MLEIYVGKEYEKDSVMINDYFFNRYTFEKVQKDATLFKVAESLMTKWSKETGYLGLHCLSTGCKTVLNVLAFSDRIFSIVECGENALSEVFKIKTGKIQCSYKLLPFEDITNDYRVFYNGVSYTFSCLADLDEWFDKEGI